MSISSASDQGLPGKAAMEAGQRRATGQIPAGYLGPANLFAHPLAGAAAMSALGIGVASHAFGVWIGTMTGAALASQRLFAPMIDEPSLKAEDFRDAARTPVLRAREAADALLTDLADSMPAADPVKSKPVRKPAAPKALPETEALKLDPPAAAVEAIPVEALVADASAKAVLDETPAVADLPVVREPVAEVARADDVKAETAVAVAVEAETVAKSAAAAFRKPVSIDRPDMVDDLKAIAGIGPKLEGVLNGLGVWTYGQIAAWTPAEMGWVDDRLGFKGRIERDDWLGQAAKLSGKGG
jgi:NADH-quinone oxidoreductase subunit E